MKRVLAAFAGNTVFANIVLLLIFVGGGLALSTMRRETFPQFSVDKILVTVAYPGADPEEVEEGIVLKVEEALEGVEGVKQYTTQSRENVGTTMVEVKEDYDVDKVLDRVRSKVGAISTFPVDAEEPVITEITVKDPVMLLYLSGDMSERRIKEWSEKIKDEIQQLPNISQVETFGARDYEIAIEMSEARMRQYRLTFSDVADAVRQSSLNLAGGTIRTREEEIRVRTMGRKYTGQELAAIADQPARGHDDLDAGATVGVVLDAARTYARIYVPEALRSSIQPGKQLDVRIDGQDETLTGTVRWVSADASFTPYFALTEHDRSRLSFLAEVDVPEAAALPSGVPLEVDFPAGLVAND